MPRKKQSKPEVIMVANSCGCIFCDLGVELHEDKKGFHHIAHGERVRCPIKYTDVTIGFREEQS